MDHIEPWEVLRRRTIVDRPWMTLRVEQVRLPDETVLDEYYTLDYPDWSEVICLDEEGRLVMIEQYRHGLGATSLELPAGVVDPGETPLEGAKRELLEETGHEAETWTPLGALSPNPARQTNRVHVYVASGARRAQGQDLDAGEHIRVRVMAVSEVLEAAMDGGIVHASHVAALLRAERAGLLARDPR